MPIDVSQFYQAFYEESLEMLKGMEQALLELDINQLDPEKINVIFRAIHSIKGGGATLGFNEITTFTHTVETFLSQVRSGIRSLKQEDISLLFTVIDCITAMIKNLQENKPIDTQQANEIEKTFHNLLNNGPGGTTPPSTGPTAKKKDEITPPPIQSAPPDKSITAPSEPLSTKPAPISDYKSEISTIRVSVNKIDLLVNELVEIVITQSILNQIAKSSPGNIDRLKEELEHLNRNLTALQESVMRIRMLPIGFLFQPFHRMVRDTMTKLGKKVELKISGEETELDKVMLEHINDPLLHLVRNALDHGIESPETRIEKGKPPIGLLQLSAHQEGGNIVISIQDDGRGIDADKVLAKAKSLGLIKPDEVLNKEQIYSLLFRPGFSTADQVTELSGRGVGLDVVYKNIHAIGGDIEIKSTPNVGSTFILKFPLTLSIMECQLVKLGENIFIIPLISLIEINRIDKQRIKTMGEDTHLYQMNDNYIPMIYLNQLFNIEYNEEKSTDEFLLVVEIEGQRYGLVADNLLGQQQVAIKSLEENYQKIPGISGATILGDGSIGLILDVYGIVTLASMDKKSREHDFSQDELPRKKELVEEKPTLPSNFQLLSFRLGQQEYAIDMRRMIEIRKLGKTTPLPRAANYVKGVTNVHGVLIPVVNLRERFHLENNDETISSIMYVLKIPINGRLRTIGVLVDAIGDSYTIDASAIKPSPHLSETLLTQYVKFVVTTKDKRMLAVLDTTDLIPFKENEELGA